MCACASPKKKEKVKEILRTLLTSTQKNSGFHRIEIEKAIKKALWLHDKRAIADWFDLMFSLELFEQPKPDCFVLCWPQLVELDVSLPDIDVNQRRLSNV